MIQKPKVTFYFFLQENLKEIVLISVFCFYYFYSVENSVRFTDMYCLVMYQKYNCASKFWQSLQKGSVKLIKRVKIAHSFLVCVKSVSRYHFKLANVILQMAVKEFFQTHF